MKHRFTAVVVASLLLAIPAFARVLSYAPYSNRTSFPGFHERNTRHFVMIESIQDSNVWDQQQLVLYDTEGGEPRVVYPPDGGSATIDAAALYERKSAPDSAPFLMATVWRETGYSTIFSSDGGATWKDVPNSREMYVSSTYENDFGGPSVLGMTNPIRSGTDAWPFIVSYSWHGVYVITAEGELASVTQRPYTSIVGQDRTGTRLLLRDLEKIEYVDLNAPNGNRRTIVPATQTLNYTGWITSDGSAYILATHTSGRYLFLNRNGETHFILGPYGQTPPAALDQPWAYGEWRDAARFFAVPTSDFEGAWLLQRETGKPTTLSRHTLGGTTQTMWSDVSGPQVEALIAGASGETLLLQVHRDRSVQMQRPFVDPALAVWRVGEPAPKKYDELFLNEEWNKGFVHVDVDRIVDGEPFVFNSGAFRDDGDIIISPGVGGGGDVVQEWGVVRASLRQHLVLPGVARLNGAFSSRWLTDVTIFNPLPTTQTVDVRYVALGEPVVQTSAVRQQTITLQPREIRFIPDVLHALFAITDGGGALHFIPAEGINVTGRTYSYKEDGGTFGFGMQAIDRFNAASLRFPVTFAGAFPGQHFRTNILLTDTSGVGTEAQLNAYGITGPIGSNVKTIDAPPGGVLQFNGMAGSLGLLSVDRGGLLVQPTRGTAIATVVAIDNRTNDPTYFPPDLPASDHVRAIPVIGHVDGANGSHFRSDVYLFNPTADASTVTLEAKQWDSPTMKMTNFTLLPREARVVTDALPTLFQMSGLARLRYWSNTQGDGVRVTSRTYTIDESDATYGSLIPPLNNFQIAAPGDQLEILGISGGEGFRTNLGLVELSPSTQAGEATVRVRMLDQSMHELDAFTVKITRAGGTQINDLFGSRGVAPPEAAMIEVQVLEGGLIGAYATLVDNITNDSTYLGAQLAAQEN